MMILTHFSLGPICMKKLTFSIFSFLLVYLSVFANDGKYPIKNFGPADYRAGIQNIDFAQNRDLTLFAANNLGVLSFNGNEWEVHAFNTGKKQRSLAFDESTNRLYVGSQGEFGYIEDDWEYHSLLELIPENSRDFDEVWDVFLFDSKVYFCTFQSIYVFSGDEVKVISRPGGFNRSFLSGNRLFTQSPEGDLFEIDDDRLVPSEMAGHPGQIIAGIIHNQDGYVVFYNSGRIEFANSIGVAEIYPELSLELEGKYVNHVLQLSDTRFVISTQRAGIYLFREQDRSIEKIGTEDGLRSNDCLRTFQDYNGNLWVGMQNGIALVDINSPLRLVNKDIDLRGSGYEAFELDEGTYYSTSNGIYFLPEGANSSTFLAGTEGPAYGMQMINFKLYAGHHTGLFKLENGKAVRIAETDGLWEIKQVQSNPRYAIGGSYSGLYLFQIDERGELEFQHKIKGFDESSRFFEEDRKGHIWVGQYYKGLYQLQLDKSFQNATVTKVSESSEYPIQQYVILSRIDDEIYIGTSRGIYMIDQTSDSIIEAEIFSEIVGEQWVYLISQDHTKNVHIYSEDLIGYFKQVSPSNYEFIPSSLYQLSQTFNNDLLRISVNVKNGIMYNANEGFIQYVPALEDKVSNHKPPIISRVYAVAEDSVLYSKLPFIPRTDNIPVVQLSEGTRILQFHVESFQFKESGNQRFRYFLTGFEEGYGDWSNVTLKEYTNLSEGNYEFYVQTLNSMGEVVTSQPIRILVDPPFYRTTLAKVAYAILIILVLYMAYRAQRRYYKRKQGKLVAAKREELEAKQLELQELKEEKIKSELRHVNNLLAASTMNLVVKNEFMENIKQEIKHVQKEKNKDKALERIAKEIDTTLKVQEDWKQFEHHFDRVHGDFLSRLTSEFLDLTPGEQKLCAFLRLKMDTKQIANLMGISLRGVEVARYRLRKKLDLSSEQNLSKFILEY